jgi:beta-glucanase (GH16 family)
MLTLFLMTIAFLGSHVLASLPTEIPNYSGLTLAYQDDFDNLNEAVWTIVDGFVQTPYAQVCYTANSVKVENGYLVLKTRKADAMCNYRGENKRFSYTSGWIDSQGKFAVKDGMMEVRSQLPPPVNKIWPAAWVISDKNLRDTGLCWPISNEIDVYEMTGGLGNSDVCGSQHYGFNCNEDLGFNYRCTARPDDGFHTYATRWGFNSNNQPFIIWYLDGKVYGKDEPAAAPIVDAMAVVLNMALSANGSGPPGVDEVGVTHKIDWIRLWKGQ